MAKPYREAPGMAWANPGIDEQDEVNWVGRSLAAPLPARATWSRFVECVTSQPSASCVAVPSAVGSSHMSSGLTQRTRSPWAPHPCRTYSSTGATPAEPIVRQEPHRETLLSRHLGPFWSRPGIFQTNVNGGISRLAYGRSSLFY